MPYSPRHWRTCDESTVNVTYSAGNGETIGAGVTDCSGLASSAFGVNPLVTVQLTRTSDAENVERAIRKNTRMVYVETPTNPLMRLSDLSASVRSGKLAAVANMSSWTCFPSFAMQDSSSSTWG